jgi:hypothetical protein
VLISSSIFLATRYRGFITSSWPSLKSSNEFACLDRDPHRDHPRDFPRVRGFRAKSLSKIGIKSKLRLLL